jgi:hypothetical protein
MTVHEALARIRQIQIPSGSLPVVASAADLLAHRARAMVVEVGSLDPAPAAGVFQVAAPPLTSQPGSPPDPRIDLRLLPDGSGRLVSAGGRLLYAAASYLVDVLASGA